MSYLFIDSTYDLNLGILDDELEWLAFDTISGKKVSTVIQIKAYELLKSKNLDPSHLKGIISINGPGFYTGLRLSEGFSDVFHFFNVPTYSFYSYEIPLWCGEEAGVWFTKAYRGEYFLHHWDKDLNRNELVSVKELPETLKNLPKIYIHSDVSLDELSRGLVTNQVSTIDLLKTNSKAIFQNVLKQNLKREVFYFRAPEDEFKVNP